MHREKREGSDERRKVGVVSECGKGMWVQRADVTRGVKLGLEGRCVCREEGEEGGELGGGEMG